MTLQSKKASVTLLRRHHKVLFRNPKASVSMAELAQRIIALNFVYEVLVGSCKEGFIAKVWFLPGKTPKYPSSYIAKYVSRDFGSIMKDIG